ncbi:protein amnionless [Neosynchiropus ocellatus]
MLKPSHALCLLCVLGTADALYKQWIPDTNYENHTNWDKGAVPCGSDVVQFLAQRKVSVFVETSHAVKEMRLPIDGEFILNTGAGFHVFPGQEPGCGAGVTTKFKDSEALQWFNPALWKAAVTQDDLESGDSLFSVHEESVPCQYDDVVFRSGSSFRVDTSSDQPSIPVKSVSVLGKRFNSASEFTQYLSSRSGQLQFHGSAKVAAGSSGCQDPTGCDCGNSGNKKRICRSVKCSSVTCKKPLSPIGHCCQVCGATVAITYGQTFNLQAYRERIKHLFLVHAEYKSVQVGMSKVFKPQRLLGIVPLEAAAEIQVVIVDAADGTQAEALARDIVEDAGSHGASLGIAEATFEASSGGSSGQSGNNTGTVVGTVFGVLIVAALIIVVTALVHTGRVRMPPLPAPRFFRRNADDSNLGGAIDQGFENPMFDKPSLIPEMPGLYNTEINSISLTHTGMHFVNPAYDENETDFNV